MKKLATKILFGLLLAFAAQLSFAPDAHAALDGTNIQNVVTEDQWSSIGSLSYNAGTGSDRVLVAVLSITFADSNQITAVTYGGVSLACQSQIDPYIFNRVYLCHLKDPATGSNTFDLTSGDDDVVSAIIFYVDEAQGVRGLGGNRNDNATPQVSITPVENGSLLIGGMSFNDESIAGDIAGASGTTEVGEVALSGLQDTWAGYKTSAGSATTLDASSGSDGWAFRAIEITEVCDYTSGYCTESFWQNGSWTVPAGVSTADMACWGGGGGGDVISGSGGGGGGGGAFASSSPSVTPSDTWTVTIGAGGVGATSPTAGGNSSVALNFATSTLACGGTQASNTTGGAGGTTLCSTGTTEFAGGGGGGGSTTGDVGGGGGGAAGPNNSGGNGANGASNVGGGGGGSNNGATGNASGSTGGTGANGGGDGGNGGNASRGFPGLSSYNGGGGGGGGDDGENGGLGGWPGGGGGGAELDSNGGDGASGLCTIRFTGVVAPGGDRRIIWPQ